MLHSPIFMNVEGGGRAARRAVMRAARQAQRQTPGAYIRKCRERAGMSHDEVAAKITAHYGAQAFAVRDLAALEADQPGDYSCLVRSLQAHEAFAFSLPVFYSLAAATCDAGLDEFHAA